MTPDGRHLTISTLDKLWMSDVPVAIPIEGTPLCRLRLDPEHEILQLITEYDTPEPDVSRLENIRFDTSILDGEVRGALTVKVEGTLHGAYGLLAAVADELQVAQAPLAVAVATAVTRHRRVFASRSLLTVEREIGLYGELLFMEYLIDAIGAGEAVASWQGPLAEEHDYVFGTVHFEVKTTSTERRKHVVHGLTQLMPLRNVPLGVLSIQLTRTSGSDGRTLAELVADVRRQAGGYAAELDRRLSAQGWEPDDVDLYRTVWTLRSRPRFYRVQDDFPVMTRDVLEQVVSGFHLISDVTYKIDLTDRVPDDVPSTADGFVEMPQKGIK